MLLPEPEACFSGTGNGTLLSVSIGARSFLWFPYTKQFAFCKEYFYE